MAVNKLQYLFMSWLRAILIDEKHRAKLRALLQNYELPVIEFGDDATDQLTSYAVQPQK